MDTRIRSWAGCPRASCAHVETDWWQACRGWARSWLVRWWSNATNAARRAAGAHKASCTGRMCICRLGAGWSTCRRRWPRWSAPTWSAPSGCRRCWRRSRRSTWSCWPAGSWTSPWPRPWRQPRGSAGGGGWRPRWSRRWPTWWSPRWPEGSCPCPGCLANPPWWPRRQAPSRRAGWVAMMRGEHKVHALHLERAAIVYVRQSTLVQVREHTESTARQYGLSAVAVELGWAPGGVVVIDADLGVSGRFGEARGGFREVVSRVCLGEVGAIFGLEVSRLGRSSAELTRLMELARPTDTLLIDADGVYDLSNANDRLLLGLKGTLSEAELHLLAGRLHGAKLAAAHRGDLRSQLAVGYVYDEDGQVLIDPDEQVRAAVEDLLAEFARTGSALGVVRVFAEAGRLFPQRAWGGAWAGKLRWGKLTYARVLQAVHNPAYAGAYTYGRSHEQRRVQPDGTVRSSRRKRVRADWTVTIQDHHPGYITWQRFLDNETKLAANQTKAGARPVREGHALCQGIIGCGVCGG